MKVSVIILGLLFITAVYGFDPEKCLKYNHALSRCQMELNVLSQCSAKVVECSFVEYGGVLDENGEYILEAGLQGLTDVISSNFRLKKAHWIVNTCYKQVKKTKATGIEMTRKMIFCGLAYGILDLLNYEC